MDTSTGCAPEPRARRALEEADRLFAAGRRREAVEVLMASNARRPAPQLEERLVELRHAAATAAAPTEPPSGAWPVPEPDRFDGPGLPEVAVDDLAVDVLRAAMVHRGGLLVRGLLDEPTARRLLDDVRRSFDAAAAWVAGAVPADTTPWYVPFAADDGYSFGELERGFTQSLGGVLAVESPRSLFDVVRALTAAGVGDLLEAHFGEWPAISAKKSTLRRATPTSPTEWHQDGAFLGSGTRSINVWTALTPCGVDAPGIDVFPRGFDHIVATGTDSARFSWSVSAEQAERLGVETVERPVFEAGDALIFDQMALHRTGVGPGMSQDRYALETWFFAPSTYPQEQVPILF